MFAKPKWAAGGQNASNQAYVTCNINEPRCTDAPSLNAANSVGTLTSLTSPKARTCKYHVDTRAITPVQKHYVPENPQKPWKEASAETNIRNPHLSTTRQKVQRNKGSNRMINAPEDSSSGHFNPQGMSSSSPSEYSGSADGSLFTSWAPPQVQHHRISTTVSSTQYRQTITPGAPPGTLTYPSHPSYFSRGQQSHRHPWPAPLHDPPVPAWFPTTARSVSFYHPSPHDARICTTHQLAQSGRRPRHAGCPTAWNNPRKHAVQSESLKSTGPTCKEHCAQTLHTIINTCPQ